MITCYSCTKDKKPNYIDLGDKITQKIENENALIYFNKGEEFLNQSEFDSASVNFKKSLAIEKNTLTYNQLGNVECLKKNYNKAIEFHKLGIISDSTCYFNYLNISKCYIAKNDLENAKIYTVKAIKINNSNYSVALGNLYLSVIYMNKHSKCDTVLNYFKKAKILENDEKMADFYMLTKKKIEKDCK